MNYLAFADMHKNSEYFFESLSEMTILSGKTEVQVTQKMFRIFYKCHYGSKYVNILCTLT